MEALKPLDPDRLAVRWFLFSIDIIGQIFNCDLRSKVAKGTNLCTFFQLSAAGILALILHLGLLLGLYYAVIQFPVSLFGGIGYIQLIISITAICISFLGTRMYLNSDTHRQRKNRAYERKSQRRREKVDKKLAALYRGDGEKPKQDSFLTIAWSYIKSVTDNFCPKVNWTKPISTESRDFNFVLNASQYVLVVLGIVVLIFAFKVIAWTGTTVKANWQIQNQATCTLIWARQYDRSGPPEVDLKCGEVMAWTVNPKTVVHFLNFPKSKLICDVYHDREAYCNVPK